MVIRFMCFVILMSFGCTTLKCVKMGPTGEYRTGRGHLFSGNTLIFYPDSTFTLFRGGPRTTYTCGKWRCGGNSKTFVLEENSALCNKYYSEDTVYASLGNTLYPSSSIITG